MPIMQRNRSAVSRVWQSGRNGKLILGGVAAVVVLCVVLALALVLRPPPSNNNAADIIITTPTLQLRAEASAPQPAAAFPSPLPEETQAAPAPTDLPAPAAAPTEAQPLPPTASIESSPTPAAPAGPQATLKAGNEFVNVRSGPGLSFDIVVELKPGQAVPVLGKSADGVWWQIGLPDNSGSTGWAFAEYLDITGDTSGVPVVQ